jgi:hypothetical protein
MPHRCPSASMFVRNTNSLSIVKSDVALLLRTNQRCCAKQVPILAVSAALKMIVKSIEIADT